MGRQRHRHDRARLILAAASVALVGVACTPMQDTAEDTQDSAPARLAAPPSSESTADETPSSTTSAPATLVVVPDVAGQTEEDAEASLVVSGLVLGTVTTEPSGDPVATVLSQSTAGGEKVAVGTAVDLVVAAPLPQVPKVVGMTKARAIRALESAGYAVTTVTEVRRNGAAGVVLRQTPAAGKGVAAGATVTIVISKIKIAPLVETNCADGYSPCLAPMSDYDCAGGSGDGPGYATGPIKVTGSDPYDLDNDGDGIACDA